MNGNLLGTCRLIAGILLLLALGFPAQADETFTTKTNWVERSITNVIEVSVPVNKFVTQYHTNRIEQLRTNIVIAYKTNWLKHTVTNEVVVDAFRTNFVKAYATNWVNRSITNWVSVDAFRTNLVDRFTTNRKTLNLTNWETVIVMKTNWITQPVTNVVQFDIATKGAAGVPKPGTETKESLDAAPVQPAPTAKEGLVLEAAKTGRPPINNNVEVELRVKSEGTIQVLKWKVEKDDGTILSFGQDHEFKRDLPIGRYKVEARVQGEANTPVQVLRGTLEVTPREAFIQQQKLFGKN